MEISSRLAKAADGSPPTTPCHESVERSTGDGVEEWEFAPIIAEPPSRFIQA